MAGGSFRWQKMNTRGSPLSLLPSHSLTHGFSYLLLLGLSCGNHAAICARDKRAKKNRSKKAAGTLQFQALWKTM